MQVNIEGAEMFYKKGINLETSISKTMEDKIKLENDKEIAEQFETKVRNDLMSYLQREGKVDEHIPECIDVEEAWPEIARSYIQDGAREFIKYPMVSLGWMMFIGMAMAYYWDEDWERYAGERKFYETLRDKRGYDELDDTILYDLLKYEGEAADKEAAVVSECASRVYSMLNREQIEPGTSAAFGCYIAALHQLYLAGMAMELKTLGYKMTRLDNA